MTTLTRHLKAPADQPPRKPLYLMGTAAARMDAGADHLILHKGAGSLMRFPLARVCRVICTRHLTWSGAALALWLLRPRAMLLRPCCAWKWLPMCTLRPISWRHAVRCSCRC
mgnify:CR=1 FL=1